MPVSALVDECPLYDLEPEPPANRLGHVRRGDALIATTAIPTTRSAALLASANVASRRWAFEQYDFLVGSRTVRRPEQADAAVLSRPRRRRDRLARSRCRSTAAGAASPADPTSAPPRPSASAPRTSPAPARSRSA
jgi:phosphoribosylformylglycinamidine synthase